MEVNERIFHVLALQQKTASQLAKYIGISNASVSGWKNSGSYPSSKYLKSISEFLKVTPDYLILGTDNLPPTLRVDEKNILRLYNELDDSGRRLHLVNLFRDVKTNRKDREWYAENEEVVQKLFSDAALNDDDIYDRNNNTNYYLPEDEVDLFESDDRPYPVLREVIVYDLPSSAGTGTFLDSEDYKIMEFPYDIVPLKTTFGVRISGDSMEPAFHNEGIVFVRQQPILEENEIGVFMLNGDSYIKKLSKNKKDICLVSVNPKYKSIRISKDDELRVLGKVIGVSKDL